MIAAIVGVAASVYVLRRASVSFRPVDTPLEPPSRRISPNTSAVSIGSEISAAKAQRQPPTSPLRAIYSLQRIEKDVGSAGRTAFENLLRSYREVVLVEHEDPNAGEALGSSLLASNGALRAAGRSYPLDIIDDRRAGPILTSHYVARQRIARAEGVFIPIYRVQRLDTINRSLAVLGYTRPQLGAAIVTLDQLEGQVVDAIAPALVEKGRARLADPEVEDAGEDWVQPLEARAGEVLRREYASLRTAELDRIVELLARRDWLFWGFRRATASTGLSFSQPVTLVSRASLGVLEGLMPDSELREWRDINDELAREPMQRAFDELMDRYGRSVHRHEVQHQIHFRRGGLVVIPAELRQLLGVRETMDIRPDSAPAQCCAELSAYLASIATGGEQAVSTLIQAANLFFN